MDSEMFRLKIKDIANGLVIAVGTAVALTVQAMITNPEFSIFALNIQDGKFLLNVAVSAAVAYLGKKFFSTSDGKFLGRI